MNYSLFHAFTCAECSLVVKQFCSFVVQYFSSLVFQYYSSLLFMYYSILFIIVFNILSFYFPINKIFNFLISTLPLNTVIDKLSCGPSHLLLLTQSGRVLSMGSSRQVDLVRNKPSKYTNKVNKTNTQTNKVNKQIHKQTK